MQGDRVAVEIFLRVPTTLHSYAADLGQTPAFVRLGTSDTGALLEVLAG